MITHLRLELGKIRRAESIGLSDDRNQVDARAQLLHDFDVERLQGVASGSDEVQAGVHTEINLVVTARLLLLKHIGFMLVVQELDDGLPRVAVVNVVAKSGSINNGQADW